MKARAIVLGTMVVVCAFAFTSCSTQARAERKGKAAGDEICKAKTPTTPTRRSAISAVRTTSSTTSPVSLVTTFREDVRDLDRNPTRCRAGTHPNKK